MPKIKNCHNRASFDKVIAKNKMVQVFDSLCIVT